jgi:hypothetical protein
MLYLWIRDPMRSEARAGLGLTGFVPEFIPDDEVSMQLIRD